MTDIQTLKSLRERVAGLTGPDREVDVLLGDLWPDPPFNVTTKILRNAKPVCPSFTASIDSALALVERVLPGWAVLLSRIENVPSRAPKKDCEAELWIPSQNTQGFKVERARTDAPTLPLAILLALLDALIAQKQEEAA